MPIASMARWVDDREKSYPVSIMYQVSVETFVGGEVRVICIPTRPPAKDSSPVNSSPAPAPAPVRVESSPPPLVNRLDSETIGAEGVSGFGKLPKSTVFGLPARRQVARLARVLDSLASSPQDCIFFTGTLPGSTPQALLTLSQWSGYIVHRLKAWALKVAPEIHLIYCWEWQKRGALHLHLAAWCSDDPARKRLHLGLRDEWIRLLVAINLKSGVDVFRRAGGRGTWLDCLSKVRARAEWVRKSIGAYLGKYMGKAIAPGSERHRFFYPSRWWGSTNNLKRLEKRARWKREYFYPSHGAAFSAMDSITTLVEMTAEWTAQYQTKVVRGRVFLALGARLEFVRIITETVTVTERKMEAKTSKEQLDQFYLTMQSIRNLRPKWFTGFCCSYENVSTIVEYMDGLLDVPIPEERILVMVYATAAALEQAARFNQAWNSQWLGERLAMSAIQVSKATQKMLMSIWDARYLHVIEDEAVVRLRHGV